MKTSTDIIFTRERALIGALRLLQADVNFCSRNLGRPIWSLVSRILVIGSTSAAEVCRELGIDPDATLRTAKIKFDWQKLPD